MTDRELLELAARAAGISMVWEARHGKGGEFQGAFVDGCAWNPFEDDGDALRLAVQLEIQITPGPDRCTAQWFGGPLGITQCGTSVITNGDPFSATNRAIVLAAAEIGKAVQKPLAP